MINIIDFKLCCSTDTQCQKSTWMIKCQLGDVQYKSCSKKEKKKKGTICKVILLLLFHDSCYILCVKCVCKYETRVVINIYRFSILLQKNRDFPEGK